MKLSMRKTLSMKVGFGLDQLAVPVERINWLCNCVILFYLLHKLMKNVSFFPS